MGYDSLKFYAEKIENSNNLIFLETGAKILGMFKEALDYEIDQALENCPKLAVLILEMPAYNGNKRGDPMRALICSMNFQQRSDVIGDLTSELLKADGIY